jgi:2-oxoglutarate dehydrogenase E2 component (dihydrolipoamide succinyltransferase)
MSISVEVPALGESVTEAIIAEWLKNPGDFVEEDEPIVELETDKITVSVPSPVSGTIKELKGDVDDTVNVGDVIAVVEAGEAPAGDDSGSSDDSSSSDDSGESAAAAEASASKDHGDEPLSPAVSRLLEENDLSASQIDGTGPNGRILKGDVLAFLENKGSKSSSSAKQDKPSAPAPQYSEGEEPTERVKMSRLRQTVAKRLVEAQQTAAMLTTFNEVDMSAVMAVRNKYKEQFQKKYDVKLGFMSFFVKAAIAALKEYPAVNAEIDGDEIVYKNYYHVGVAVGGPKGLVVPVVKHADRMSFADVETEIGRLAGLAQKNKLAISDMQGGTFTISNGGIYGSMLSTPILNPPQVGILGMHNIVERAWVVDGKVEVRPVMYLALSYDHRIIDGKEAVSFLYRIKECLEDPERMLLEI